MTTQAQDFRLGITGGLNSTWLLNKNVFDQGDDLDVASTFGGRFGVEGIYSFSEKAGISLGLNFISGHNQKYTGDLGTNVNYDAKTMLRYLDIPVLFRLTSGSGSYFEIGPQLSILSSAKQDYTLSPDPNKTSYSGEDVKWAFNSTNVALVFGFGADIDVSENVYITTGLRLGYGFTDVTKEFKSEEEYDAANPNDDVDGFTTLAAHINDDDELDYQPTNRAFAGLHLGVSYKFSK
jgi:hypothetical protein